MEFFKLRISLFFYGNFCTFQTNERGSSYTPIDRSFQTNLIYVQQVTNVRVVGPERAVVTSFNFNQITSFNFNLQQALP